MADFTLLLNAIPNEGIALQALLDAVPDKVKLMVTPARRAGAIVITIDESGTSVTKVVL